MKDKVITFSNSCNESIASYDKSNHYCYTTAANTKQWVGWGKGNASQLADDLPIKGKHVGDR